MTQLTSSLQYTSDKPWHSLHANDIVSELQSDFETGLSADEAATRLERFGTNELQAVEQAKLYAVLARQFTNVLILILFAAAAISFIVGEVVDAITIIIIIALNGALGFVQEWRAEQAIEALQQMLSPTCNVLRDGVERTIEANGLVPGDIVILNLGDHVPADIRLVQVLNLQVDESSLTGESVAVNKGSPATDPDTPLAERVSMAWMGTAITNGLGRGVVVATGMATEFGRIAELTQAVGQESTPLQRRLGTLGKQLGALSIGVSVAVMVAGLLLGKPLLEMFLIGVSLAVAVVPEGLPAVVTITLALGIRAMVRRRALLRRLQAAETLGSASVICTDKTGTLTQNEMTVQRIWVPSNEFRVTGVGYEPMGQFEIEDNAIDPAKYPDLISLLETGLYCSHSSIYRDEQGWHQVGEPTEASLVAVANKAELYADGSNEIVMEVSFSSQRKRMTVVKHHDHGHIAYVKGAPEVLLDRSTRIMVNGQVRDITEVDRETVVAAYTSFAKQGLRTLAFARRITPDGVLLDEDEIEQKLTFIGVVGIIDPPRPEVADAIRLTATAGIDVVMITGDSPDTAMAIANQIGMHPGGVVHGNDLLEMDDERLRKALHNKALFARTTPEQKMRIVSLLQDEGHVVAMTGDGVNDAPALRKADIGIAMGIRGTDVAKGASDMVLLDDNFASIMGAVEEGRRQYDNIQKFVGYLLTSNMAELLAVFINVLVGGPLILVPVQILWINLVTDGVTAVALGLERPERGIMARPPRSPREGILNRYGVPIIVTIGIYEGAAALWLFYHFLDADGGNIVTAQTAAFTGLIMLEMILVFNFRSMREPLTTVGFFTNRWLLIFWVIMLVIQVSALYIPFTQNALHATALGWQDWLLIMATTAPMFFGFEAYKTWRIKRGKQT